MGWLPEAQGTLFPHWDLQKRFTRTAAGPSPAWLPEETEGVVFSREPAGSGRWCPLLSRNWAERMAGMCREEAKEKVKKGRP